MEREEVSVAKDKEMDTASLSRTKHDSDNDSKKLNNNGQNGEGNLKKESLGINKTQDENGDIPSNSNGHQEEVVDDGVFEVKMRKNRKSSNSRNNAQENKKRQSNDSSLSSSLLSSLPYSNSTLSLNKTIFPTGMSSNRRNNDSISMSLSRVGGSDGEDNVRITGYLEKRSKILGWKKYWFVLDGRLLLYYKSKSDYDSLSVCCGSINLGIASTVRPIQIRGCKGHPIQIVTRSQVYYLRSPNKQILDQWLLAIQEQAASSHPSKISLPIWADPGSQFFRYSFAASSQWSLNTSSEDITESLSKLPPNFFLRGGCGPGFNKNLNNNLQKCHSFASLQSPSLYSGMLNNNSSKSKKKSLPSAEAEDIPKRLSNGNPTISALKEELTRKLSVGKTEESETVKPSLTKPKSKRELLFLKKDRSDIETHYYDEIVDFEALYENCESNSNSSTRNSASSTASKISEEIPQQNELLTSQPVNDAGIYETVDDNSDNITKDIKNQQNSEIRLSSSSRKSGQSTKSECNNKTKSNDFEESSEWERSQSLSNPNILSSRSQLPRPLLEESQRKQSLDSESSSIYSSKENVSGVKGKTWKKKPFGGFFHKMFHRDKKKSKDKGAQSTSNNSLVITGPIELRSSHSDSPINRPTNLPLDEARKNSLGRSKQTSNNPSPGIDANVMDELKQKVERIHHAPPLTSVADHILSKAVQEEEGENNNSNLKQTSSMRTKERPKIPKKPQTSKKPEVKKEELISPSEEYDKLSSDLVEYRKGSQSEDFQQKLAKFNRLSESLSSAFVAALNPHSHQYSGAGTLGRSRSFKLTKEKLPPLPPKKKASGITELIYYDYPTNNRPVPLKKPVIGGKLKTQNDATEEKPNTTNISTFIRSLCKKNSAPDILFSSSRSSSEDSGHNSKDGEILEEILCPPPIPPKAKTNVILESPPLSQKSFNKPLEKSEYQTPSSIPVQASKDSSPVQEKSVEVQIVPNNSLSHTYNNVDVPDSKSVKSPNNANNFPSTGERVYQNIKFATLNTLVQEYETVEEAEEEISEMYDDFPSSSEYSGGGSHTYESISPLPPPKCDMRHSGIDQLQQFLNSETNSITPNKLLSSGDYTASEVDDNDHFPTSAPIRAGAVSRLGHSSAIDQLKKIVNYAKSDV